LEQNKVENIAREMQKDAEEVEIMVRRNEK
jgi:hypothetical protein